MAKETSDGRGRATKARCLPYGLKITTVDGHDWLAHLQMFTEHIGAYFFACITVCFAYRHLEPLLEQNIFEGIQLASLMDELKWVSSIKIHNPAAPTEHNLPGYLWQQIYRTSDSVFVDVEKAGESPLSHFIFLSAEWDHKPGNAMINFKTNNEWVRIPVNIVYLIMNSGWGWCIYNLNELAMPNVTILFIQQDIKINTHL